MTETRQPYHATPGEWIQQVSQGEPAGAYIVTVEAGRFYIDLLTAPGERLRFAEAVNMPAAVAIANALEGTRRGGV